LSEKNTFALNIFLWTFLGLRESFIIFFITLLFYGINKFIQTKKISSAVYICLGAIGISQIKLYLFTLLLFSLFISALIILIINKKISILQAILIIFVIEIIIEIFHQLGYSLDPYDYKIINFYRWADTLWGSKTVRIMDTYTEGKHNCNPHIHVKDTMKPKFEWMAKEGKVDSNSSVLEIGCGNGEFLRYLRDDIKCKNVVGVTLSPEQHKYLSDKGYNIVLSSIWDLPKNLYGKFDAIVLNGSTEHFLNCTENDDKFDEMFSMINKCLNPKSKSKRVVITCIHFHRPFF
jgi:SAM-dependent methyltransferase